MNCHERHAVSARANRKTLARSRNFPRKNKYTLQNTGNRHIKQAKYYNGRSSMTKRRQHTGGHVKLSSH